MGLLKLLEQSDRFCKGTPTLTAAHYATFGIIFSIYAKASSVKNIHKYSGVKRKKKENCGHKQEMWKWKKFEILSRLNPSLLGWDGGT